MNVFVEVHSPYNVLRKYLTSQLIEDLFTPTRQNDFSKNEKWKLVVISSPRAAREIIAYTRFVVFQYLRFFSPFFSVQNIIAFT